MHMLLLKSPFFLFPFFLANLLRSTWVSCLARQRNDPTASDRIGSHTWVQIQVILAYWLRTCITIFGWSGVSPVSIYHFAGREIFLRKRRKITHVPQKGEFDYTYRHLFSKFQMGCELKIILSTPCYWRTCITWLEYTWMPNRITFEKERKMISWPLHVISPTQPSGKRS